MIAEYLEHALQFEQMAAEATDAALKESLAKQASAYRKLAKERAERLGIPQSQSATPITRPNCPRCGTPTMLARIEPDAPGYDKCTFECVACGHELTEIVKFK